MNTNHLQPLSKLTLGEVARITGGAVAARWAGRLLAEIGTDSRILRPGQFFLALRGEKFDGHRFCEAAVRAGAAGLIVDRKFAGDYDYDYEHEHEHEHEKKWLDNVPVVIVEDTLRAYGDLGAERRREWGGTVLAISGSAGKTTTRRMTAQALRPHRRVLEPIRNYNNLVGLPYTLLDLEADREIAVLELGMNQPGELTRLTEIARPNAAILTQIGLTHAGMFARIEDLIEAKLDLFRACAPGVPLVINAGCPRTTATASRFSAEHPIIYFIGEGEAPAGIEPAVAIERAAAIEPVGYRFDLRLPSGTLRGLELRLFGRHHLANAAAAAALLHAAGLPGEWVAGALEGFRTEPLRGEIIHAGDYTFILDCYNASPPSMLGALASLVELPCPGRRVLVLADMLELGDHAPQAHAELAGPIRRLDPALFFGLGPHTARLAGELAASGMRAAGFTDRDALTGALLAELCPGDQVFFKGSHSFALEKVAQAVAPILIDSDHE